MQDDARHHGNSESRERVSCEANVRKALTQHVEPPVGEHLSLEAMERAASERAADPTGWRMPAHLEACGECLEAFEAVLDRRDDLTPELAERYAAVLSQPVVRAPWHQTWRVRVAVAMAAMVALLIAVGAAYMHRPVSVTIEQGAAVANGRGVPAGAVELRRGRVLSFVEPTTITTADGSSLVFHTDAQASVVPAMGSGNRWRLAEGTVRAAVEKQRDGNQFVVETPVATVTVIGTRFEVHSTTEAVQEFRNESGATGPTAASRELIVVTVDVEEGVVEVSNDHRRVKVHAGQRAVVRQAQAYIEVTEKVDAE